MKKKSVRALYCAFFLSLCAFGAAAEVVIDAAHGGKDSGASGTYLKDGRKITLLEKDIALAIAQKIRRILSEKNAANQVRFTRMGDEFLSFEQRARFASEKGAAEPLVVSLHVNASMTHSVTGFEVWTVSADTGKYKEAAASLSAALENAIGGQLENRGIKDWNSDKTPAHILVELGFLSNAHDAELLADDGFLELCARAISDWAVGAK